MDEPLYSVSRDEWGPVFLVIVFLRTSTFALLAPLTFYRFFMYIIDLRNNAKEKKLRVLLGTMIFSTIICNTTVQVFFSFFWNLFIQTLLVRRGRNTATPFRRSPSPAQTPVDSKSDPSIPSSLLWRWRTAPFPVLIVQRFTNSWHPSKSTWRRIMLWSMRCLSLVLSVESVSTPSSN